MSVLGNDGRHDRLLMAVEALGAGGLEPACRRYLWYAMRLACPKVHLF